nr:MAG TPA: hypothetical protein [Caudoviricetes sp.]
MPSVCKGFQCFRSIIFPLLKKILLNLLLKF